MSDIERELRLCADAHGDSATADVMRRAADQIAHLSRMVNRWKEIANGNGVALDSSLADLHKAKKIYERLAKEAKKERDGFAAFTRMAAAAPRPANVPEQRRGELPAAAASKSERKRINVLSGRPMMEGVKSRVSLPECLCNRCSEVRGDARTFFNVCPTCGNKRCPRATAHWLACTNSNKPGQPGSDYGDSPAPMAIVTLTDSMG